MVEKGGSDVIKMSKESEKTSPELVVPHLSKDLFIIRGCLLQPNEILTTTKLYIFKF